MDACLESGEKKLKEILENIEFLLIEV